MNPILFISLALATSTAFAEQPSAQANPNVDTDMVRLVGVDEMPIAIPPGELEKAKRPSLKRADDGISTLEHSPETIRRFFNNVDIVKTHAANQQPPVQLKANGPKAPIVYRDISELKLGFAAARLSRGELIGITPRGTIVGNAWTGMERYYEIPGTGIYRLTETDLRATGGMFYMIKQNVNSTVAGKPAIAKVFTDSEGQKLEEVLWVNGPKLYMLTFAPETAIGRFGRVKTNPRISAISLAQDLR